MTKTFRGRITDDWLPMPEDVLAGLGWPDGTYLEAEIIGDAVVLTRAADQSNPKKPGARVVRAMGTGVMPSNG